VSVSGPRWLWYTTKESGEIYFLRYFYFKYIKIIFFILKIYFYIKFLYFWLGKKNITINFYHLWFLYSREINGWSIRFKKVGPCTIFLMKPGRSSVVNGITKPCASHNPRLPKSNIPLIILNITKEKKQLSQRDLTIKLKRLELKLEIER
jgi:hypothetical protein